MKKAVIFPGQGSQYPNMGLSLYQRYPKAKEVFDRVDAISGVKVTEAIFGQDSSQLKNTAIQQLAILAVSLAAYQEIKDKLNGLSFLAGLSLGEYSCLYAAGVLSLEDIVILVKARAQAMQRAAEENPSVMFAIIGAKRKDLETKSKDSGFYIANLNTFSQVVISLSDTAKNRIREELEAEGLKVIELEVSGGFHSPFMEPAREELRKVIDRLHFSDAEIPIVSNVTAAAHTEGCQIKENLLIQLVSPVLWADSVSYMAEKGVNLFYEVGPSRVLKGLLRKIDKNLRVLSVEKAEDIEEVF